uniref:Uncharacterized protein n=1 Tax=Arundo donax TaxID=35708 RepID=A0A0A8YR21_ARUDO
MYSDQQGEGADFFFRSCPCDFFALVVPISQL